MMLWSKPAFAIAYEYSRPYIRRVISCFLLMIFFITFYSRFAQFFLCPLFTESATSREMNAVDNENEKNVKNDSWRIHQLQHSLSKPGHDYHKFGTGTHLQCETLFLYTRLDDLIEDTKENSACTVDFDNNTFHCFAPLKCFFCLQKCNSHRRTCTCLPVSATKWLRCIYL